MTKERLRKLKIMEAAIDKLRNDIAKCNDTSKDAIGLGLGGGRHIYPAEIIGQKLVVECKRLMLLQVQTLEKEFKGM